MAEFVVFTSDISWPLVGVGGLLGVIIFLRILASHRKNAKRFNNSAVGKGRWRRSKNQKGSVNVYNTPQKMFPKARNKDELYAQIGAKGESDIYNILVQLVGPQSVFKNVYVRRSSGRLTEIDLLAVHATGVYVVESKNYSGMVVGDGKSKDWSHIRGNYNRSFYSPVLQNAGHIDALRTACTQRVGFVPPMLSVIVFPDRCELKIQDLPAGLRCCRLSQLSDTLRSVAGQVKVVLSPADMQVLNNLFSQSQRDVLPASVRIQHEKDVASARAWARGKK